MHDIRFALRAVPESDGLTKEDICKLSNKIHSDMLFPIVIEGNSSYALGFMENDAYTDYLEHKDNIDGQVKRVLNDWENLCASDMYKLDTTGLPDTIGDAFWLYV